LFILIRRRWIFLALRDRLQERSNPLAMSQFSLAVDLESGPVAISS
jgi:hypothetical protein